MSICAACRETFDPNQIVFGFVSPVERLRIQAGITMTEACERSRIAKRTMRAAERMDWAPTVGTVVKIANLYGVDPAELLEDMRRFAAQLPDLELIEGTAR